MIISKIEGKLILFFQVISLHLFAFFSKIYLLKNRKLKQDFVLLNEMKGLEPVILFKKKENKCAYLVRGTSILILPRYTAASISMEEFIEKYAITVGLNIPPWQEQVKLEYIFDTFPERIKQKFLFSLHKFN